MSINRRKTMDLVGSGSVTEQVLSRIYTPEEVVECERYSRDDLLDLVSEYGTDEEIQLAIQEIYG